MNMFKEYSPEDCLKGAWYLGIFSSAIMAVAGIFGFMGLDYSIFLDVVLVLGLVAGVRYKKSRICGVTLFCYWVFNKVYYILQVPESFYTHLIYGIIFGWVYYKAMRATFTLKKIARKNSSKCSLPPPPPSKDFGFNPTKVFLERKKYLFQLTLFHLREATTKSDLRDQYEMCLRAFKEFAEENKWEFSDSIEEVALKDLFEALYDFLPDAEDTEWNDNEFDEKETYESSKSEDVHQQYHEFVKEKNQRIFDVIWDIKELKKKYYKLAKINHPDRGGSLKAMQVLNRYYQEALERIQGQQEASSY